MENHHCFLNNPPSSFFPASDHPNQPFLQSSCANNNVTRVHTFSELMSSSENHAGALEHYAEGDQIEVDYDEAYFESFPPGYRFEPTDEELVIYYLKNKVYDQPLPPNWIKNVRLYDTNPMLLSEKYKPIGDMKWYFFTPTDKKYPKGGVINRSALNGFWKATGHSIAVKSSEGHTIGHKRTLVFYDGRVKTKWIMQEYKLANLPKRIENGPNDTRLRNYVLCRIYNKRRTKSISEWLFDTGEKNLTIANNHRNSFMNVMSQLHQNMFAENGGQILNFEEQVWANTENTLPLQSQGVIIDNQQTLIMSPRIDNSERIDPDNLTFDDDVLNNETNKSCSTIFSQPLEQNANINLYVGAVENISAGFSVPEIVPAGFRVSETALTGFEIAEIVCTGFGVPENIQAGFRSSENVGIGIIRTDNPLKRQKYNPNEMQFDNYVLWEQKDKPCSTIPWQPLEQNTNTNRDANINLYDAVAENVTDVQNINVEYSVAENVCPGILRKDGIIDVPLDDCFERGEDHPLPQLQGQEDSFPRINEEDQGNYLSDISNQYEFGFFHDFWSTPFS